MAAGRKRPVAGEALYERYKDALKRGHVASLRGRLDEALDAYAEASSLAPERPTPHASAGTALLRRRRFADALRYYEAALSLAPRDETALLGRAQALAALDRRPDAADAFDALADLRAQAGKLADAVDAARRGLELAEGRDRRRTLERLIERLRASEPGEPGRLALERALRVLEGPSLAAPPAGGRWAPSGPGEGVAAGSPDEPAAPVSGSGPGASPEDASAARDRAEPSGTGEDAEAAASARRAGPQEAPAPVRTALDRDLPPDADPDALTVLAEAALDAGAGADAVERLLDLAAANRSAKRLAAALDACYLALALDPDSVPLHLALVQLYDEAGWTTVAADKLELLERLVALDADEDAAARVAAARTGRP